MAENLEIVDLSIEPVRQELFGTLVEEVGRKADRADNGADLYRMLAADRDNHGPLQVATLPYSEETGLPEGYRDMNIFWTDEMKVGDLRRIKGIGEHVVRNRYRHVALGVGLSTLSILRAPEDELPSEDAIHRTAWLWKNH